MILFKKLKKTNKLLLVLFIVLSLAYIVSYAFLANSILNLNGIETLIRVVSLISLFIIFLVYILVGLICLITKHHKIMIFILLFISIMIPLFIFASYHIDKTLSKLDKVSKNEILYTTNLIVLKGNKINNTSDEKIAMIKDEQDIEGYVIAKKLIEKEKLDNIQIKYYDDYLDMIDALYTKEVDGILVSSNYSILFSNEEEYENIQNETSVLFTYSEKRENEDKKTVKNSKKLTEPFTILLIGVDSEKETMNANQAFNGDTLMLITFNPKTLNAVVFSIPRDTYVPISCRKNAQNKINSSAYGGTSCVINTIQNYTGINIDYYVKINFKGVVNLVDALGGITVDVGFKFCEQDSNREFGEHEICLKKGVQELNGEQALAFSRHRKTLPLGDFQRVQNQQLVVEAIAKKATEINSINKFYAVLDAIANNIDTNMEKKQMLSFYEVAKTMLNKISNNENNFFTIEKTYLTGSDKSINGAYTFQASKESLNDIINALKVNLEIKKPELIKTFNFSGQKEYEKRVYGKDLIKSNKTSK